MALEQMMRPEEQPQAPGALSQSRPPVQQQDYAQQMMSTMLNRVNPTAYTGLMDQQKVARQGVMDAMAKPVGGELL